MAGSGSTFTLYLPLQYVGAAYSRGVLQAPAAPASPQPAFQPVVAAHPPGEEIADDRDDLDDRRADPDDRRG